jgi:hypothetical protein
VAAQIWDLLGDVSNYLEPFCGSAAVLLGRPTAPKFETLNDMDYMVANFWRATTYAPEKVARWCDWPVNEADLHAVHRWLVLSDDAVAFRKRMREDPDYFDAKVAGRWCWGLCCWIGSGWCSTPEAAEWEPRLPQLADAYSRGRGVHNDNHLSQKIPCAHGSGVHNDNHLGQAMPSIGGSHPSDSPGHKGVNLLTGGGTCEQRTAWLLEWFGRLRDRLRSVRVCCGDWLRVCRSEYVTTFLGTAGIFFDPPYGAAADRTKNIYATDSLTVAADVRAYCLERGSNPMMRLVLAGYEGEGHEVLEAAGWGVIEWQAHGGYGNRSAKAKGKENAKKERLWYSPHCVQQDMPLFG